MRVKVRLVLYAPQGSPVTFLDTVSSFSELMARSAAKWPCEAFCIHATTRSGERLFRVDSEEAFEKLALLLHRDSMREDRTTTARVRLALTEDDDMVQDQDCRTPARRCNDLCSTSPPPDHAFGLYSYNTPSPTAMTSSLMVSPPHHHGHQQSWDEAALLSSIKQSVARWHFGSRLQHLAA